VTVTTHENYHGSATATKEKDAFRAYDSLEAAADDYGHLLATSPRFSSAFAFKKDPVKFIHAIKVVGYATDPNYEHKIVSIIRENGLADYDDDNVPTSATYSNPVHQ
jgi:flagellar protein FlgJ